MIAGNWKMNLRADEARDLATAVAQGVDASGPRVLLFPGHTLLTHVAGVLDGSPVELGGQDLHPDADGAHTGDVSGPQLVDAGCSWVLVGHSERRQNHNEGDGLLAAKLDAAHRSGLRPVLCVGETASERSGGLTRRILDSQLEAGLFPWLDGAPDGAMDPADLVLAYEPVWAIGTGEVATPEIAAEAHRHLRQRLAEHLGEDVAAAVRILYGGSVKPGNAADLIAREEIDGFLVGGASLDAEKFLAIIRCC
jgi:triosephosphate isomerase